VAAFAPSGLSMSRQILVASVLPYVSGSIHPGHLVEILLNVE
jgi:methionyl-tRNA synthetase